MLTVPCQPVLRFLLESLIIIVSNSESSLLDEALNYKAWTISRQTYKSDKKNPLNYEAWTIPPPTYKPGILHPKLSKII